MIFIIQGLWAKITHLYLLAIVYILLADAAYLFEEQWFWIVTENNLSYLCRVQIYISTIFQSKNSSSNLLTSNTNAKIGAITPATLKNE